MFVGVLKKKKVTKPPAVLTKQADRIVLCIYKIGAQFTCFLSSKQSAMAHKYRRIDHKFSPYLRVPRERQDLAAVVVREAVDGELVLALLDVVGLDQRAEHGKARLLRQPEVVRVRVDARHLDLFACLVQFQFQFRSSSRSGSGSVSVSVLSRVTSFFVDRFSTSGTKARSDNTTKAVSSLILL